MENDKYIWLEEVNDQKCLDWAKEENSKTNLTLSMHPLFKSIQSKALEIYQNTDRVRYVELNGKYVYHLWTDELSIQGRYCRQLESDYLLNKDNWETLLDLDELSAKENQKWVFRDFLMNEDDSRALVTLSPGGLDSNVIREFDLGTKTFIADGFHLPISKGSAHWVNKDTIWLSRDYGEGSLTKSGYPNSIRVLKRGENYLNAKILYQTNNEYVWLYSTYLTSDDLKEKTFLASIGRDFYHHDYLLYKNQTWVELDLPQMIEFSGGNHEAGYLILKEDWREFKSKDIILFHFETQTATLAFRPSSGETVYSFATVKSGFYAIIDKDVKGQLYFFEKKNQKFESHKVDLPENGTVDFLSTDRYQDKFFVSVSSFNLPNSYFFGERGKNICVVKSNKSFFDHANIIVEQCFVKSFDQVSIPYFLVYHRDVKFDGTNPTILYGYGGFEIALKPNFSNLMGSSWLEKKGVYVLANIRGGGEYGPDWHQCALKENRQIAYNDFFAIAEDLFSKNITSSKNLGAMGGSNGGLLMGVCYTMRPELFSAINCMVPLLDMHRYHKLLAGHSWVAEYGDPDKEDGAYIKKISPYQNISENKKYPVIFVNTSTKDDRVHPGHARKFVAKLKDFGHRYYYYENIDGGHAGSANFVEMAYKHALDMCFFWQHLK